MAEAYFASCQPDKLTVAVERGLAINPDDPNLLGAFGNWLSYSGKWDEGAQLVRRALAIEPTHIVGGADTHEYWQRMSRRFADCIPDADYQTIPDTKHDGAIDKVNEFSEIILDIVDSSHH